jgi:hypothetical protein
MDGGGEPGVRRFRRKPVIVEAIRWTGENAADIRTLGTRTAERVPGILLVTTTFGQKHIAVGDYVLREGATVDCCHGRTFEANWEDDGGCQDDRAGHVEPELVTVSREDLVTVLAAMDPWVEAEPLESAFKRVSAAAGVE